ncbi:MAG: hypothetical protein OEX12_08885 [Gammaproteobacteria bacterium]|nr:hypothetical protein [Gammaproteobacteria bacterium]
MDNHRYLEWQHKQGAYEVCHCSFVPYKHKPKSKKECEQNFPQAPDPVALKEMAQTTFDMFDEDAPISFCT